MWILREGDAMGFRNLLITALSAVAGLLLNAAQAWSQAAEFIRRLRFPTSPAAFSTS